MIAACSGEATEHVRCLTRRLTATGSPLPHHQPRVYGEPGMVIGTGQRLDGSLSDDTYDGTYRQSPRALGAAEGLRVAAVEVGQVDGVVAAVDPVEEAGVDRYPVRKVLAGDDGLGIGAVEAGPVDRAGAGGFPSVGPVEVAAIDRHPPWSVLAGDDGLRIAAVETGRPDRAGPGRPVCLGGPVDVAGTDRHHARLVRQPGDDGLRVAAVQAGPVDRAGAGAGPARGPVDVAGVHCYPRRAAAPDGQEPLTAAIEVGPGDRAAPVRDVILGRPVEVAGVDRHCRGVALSADQGARVAGVEVGRKNAPAGTGQIEEAGDTHPPADGQPRWGVLAGGNDSRVAAIQACLDDRAVE